MSSFAFQACAARNQGFQCQAPRCAKQRVGINRWCRTCNDKARQYGHPDAKPFRASAWASERAAVVSLIDSNADHPGLINALAALTSWSGRAVADQHAYKGAEEVARLRRHGVTSRDILIEACACSLWLHRNPRLLPDDRSKDFALSRSVFGLAPRHRRVTRGPGRAWGVGVKPSAAQSYSPKARASALAYVGTFLRQSLAGLVANVVASIEARELRESERQEAMRAPFNIPTNDN